MVSSCFSLFLILVLVWLQLLLAASFVKEEAQVTPIESGFESNLSTKVLASSFFFLAILFVLFDMELILLFPSVVFNLFFGSSSSWAFSSLMLVVLISLLLEWFACGLKWQV